MLYFGLIILIASFVFMIVNFSKADAIIVAWLPFIFAGIFLIFMSQIMKGLRKK